MDQFDYTTEARVIIWTGMLPYLKRARSSRYYYLPMHQVYQSCIVQKGNVNNLARIRQVQNLQNLQNFL
jgi:hypothetical protein